MAKKKPSTATGADRLSAARAHGDNLAKAILASLPTQAPKRDQKVLTSWTVEEIERLRPLAEERSEPLAVLVRNLTLAALAAIEGSSQ